MNNCRRRNKDVFQGILLDAEEREILKDLEAGEFEDVGNIDEEQERLKRIVGNILRSKVR